MSTEQRRMDCEMCAELVREAKGLLEALEMEGPDSQEFYDWSMGLRAAIEKAKGHEHI